MSDQEHPAVVVRERTLDASPGEVWETLTDEVLLEQWLAADVELDLREGGQARFVFADGETRDACIELVRPAERLAFSWWADGEEDAQRVEFRLEPVGARTRLVVVETRGAGAGAGAPAWGPALSALGRIHAVLVCA